MDKLISVFQPSKKLKYMEIRLESCPEDKQKSSMMKENMCSLSFSYENTHSPSLDEKWLLLEKFFRVDKMISLLQMHTKMIPILSSLCGLYFYFF